MAHSKEIQIETCDGLVTLSNVHYEVRAPFIKITCSLSILDPDYKKMESIKLTQLYTCRPFVVADGGKGHVITFTYPLTLIRAAKF